MLLELMNELLSEFSPIYFYFGLLLTIVYFDPFQFTVKRKIVENQLYMRHSHELKYQTLPRQSLIPRIIELRNWLTTKVKRVEAPDDDADAHSFSYPNLNQIRGGQKWKKHLYSLLLKNIALS
ncbi:hypothetical protein [Oceanobacillus bengalensis]|uniref:Uncharacterized protein n=1 Tax=Oceanobacillus bengalensis TaxID=1435466 RepID=A0A494Z805_9BACI|nr:hypothetical protein [Oceanobacillus bengalensis]RKQ18667.1 hypothetical protein D8M05_00705 [Oceanobacillus bengalensis]